MLYQLTAAFATPWGMLLLLILFGLLLFQRRKRFQRIQWVLIIGLCIFLAFYAIVVLVFLSHSSAFWMRPPPLNTA